MTTSAALHATDIPTTSTASPATTSRLWAGRLLSALPTLFLLVDGGMKLYQPPVVVQSTLELGYPESAIVGIGVVLLIATILYVMPRTAVLGAILLTGYLGGAVATHVRVSGAVFNIVFPVIFGCMLWGGLWLRDNNLRRLIPVNDKTGS